MSDKEYFSYDNHDKEWNNALINDAHNNLSKSWMEFNTLDFWRHERMRSQILPLIQNNLNNSWLTIGDGRYGTDANFLLRSGAESVHCSDYSALLLKIGHDSGFITDYSSQNAESINFDGGSFDYVYCKEAFHHFPRPYLALYEMFRVAKKGVVLIEPRDPMIDPAPFSNVFNLIRKIFNKPQRSHSFEEVGNYVYAISEREIEKFLLGINFNCYATLSLNDVYIAGSEFIGIENKLFTEKLFTFKLKFKIFILDALVKLRLIRPNLTLFIIFKERPDNIIIDKLKINKWNIKYLPKNPYK